MADKFPKEESVYAAEGTLAHEVAYIQLARFFNGAPATLYADWLGNHQDISQEDLLEMNKHARTFRDFVANQLEEMPKGTKVLLEQHVSPDLEDCDGTADVVLLAATALHVIDFKYGKGVAVEAEGNPQLMVYGLGALDEFGSLLGEYEMVKLSIVQPRLGFTRTMVTSEAALQEWAEVVLRPAARQAQEPDAPFGPSLSACRFCPARGRCAAQLHYEAIENFGDPDILTPEQMGEVLNMVPELRQWLGQVEEAALTMVYSDGVPIPGWKVVLSGGKRYVADTPAAIQTLIDAGFSAGDVSVIKMQTLGVLEKLVGKHELPAVLGDLMQKSPGREALVPESDGRPSVSPTTEAIKEFSNDSMR